MLTVTPSSNTSTHQSNQQGYDWEQVTTTVKMTAEAQRDHKTRRASTWLANGKLYLLGLCAAIPLVLALTLGVGFLTTLFEQKQQAIHQRDKVLANSQRWQQKANQAQQRNVAFAKFLTIPLETTLMVCEAGHVDTCQQTQLSALMTQAKQTGLTLIDFQPLEGESIPVGFSAPKDSVKIEAPAETTEQQPLPVVPPPPKAQWITARYRFAFSGSYAQILQWVSDVAAAPTLVGLSQLQLGQNIWLNSMGNNSLGEANPLDTWEVPKPGQPLQLVGVASLYLWVKTPEQSTNTSTSAVQTSLN